MFYIVRVNGEIRGGSSNLGKAAKILEKVENAEHTTGEIIFGGSDEKAA